MERPTMEIDAIDRICEKGYSDIYASEWGPVKDWVSYLERRCFDLTRQSKRFETLLLDHIDYKINPPIQMMPETDAVRNLMQDLDAQKKLFEGSMKVAQIWVFVLSLIIAICLTVILFMWIGF